MTRRQLDELVDDILDERNDRSLIILCSSIIDEQLYDILNTLFKKIKEDDLLKGDNPLSTFSSRIKILYRIGIIDESLKGILDNVRKIRNVSAHSVALNLNKSPLKDHILTLRKSIINRPSYELMKKRYFENNVNNSSEVKSLFITICVILEAINISVIEIAENEKTIIISKR